MALKDLSAADRKKYTLPNSDPQKASDAARALFADKGGFYLEEDPNRPSNIPGIPKIMFRIYEKGFSGDTQDGPPWFADRDDIVTFVLPRPGDAPWALPDYYYRCSYFPY
jgi:hypothetical protein